MPFSSIPVKQKRNIPYKWLALVTVSFGTFMNTLDASIVMISLPRLSTTFNTDASVVLWIVVAFTLVSVCLMFTFGKIGDVIGRKRVFLTGMALFSVGLALCSISHTVTQLILSRVFQAIGSAMIGSLDMAIVTAATPVEERGRAIGILTGVVSAGLLLGPVLGGFLLELLGWQSVFYVRIPIGIIGVIVGILLLKEQKSEGAKLKFDWIGALTLSGGLACLLLFFNRGAKTGFVTPLALSLAVGAAVLLTLFIYFERKTTQSIFDLRLLRNRPFAAANVSLLIMFISLTANNFLMPFFMIQGLGYLAAKAGLLYAVYSTTSLFVAPISGWLSDRIGYRTLCTTGIAILSLGLFLLSRLDMGATEIDILWRLVVLGIGSGLFLSPNNSSILGSVSKERLGIGSASIGTVRQIGISSGTAIAGALLTSRQAFHLSRLGGQTITDASRQLALVSGYRDAQLVAAIFCALGIISALAQGRVKSDGLGKQRFTG
jgi:EmrB/QacA subfamily drug resistance transporter